jgi:hypothetical protein
LDLSVTLLNLPTMPWEHTIHHAVLNSGLNYLIVLWDDLIRMHKTYLAQCLDHITHSVNGSHLFNNNLYYWFQAERISHMEMKMLTG